MLRMNNIKMITKVSKSKLLETLRINKDRHAAIVQEARDGYVKKARKVLEKKLEELRQGKVVSLQFQLLPPVDYTKIYESSISMLEWNEQESIDLEPGEFRQLVLDEWDWRDNFLTSNSMYSKQSFDWLNDLHGGSLVAPPEE